MTGLAMASTWGAGRLRALSRTTVFRVFWLVVGFIVLKAVSAWLVFPPQQNALLWLPSGLSLAVLLRADRRRWPAYLAAIFLAEFGAVWAYGDPPAVATGWAVGNCLRSWVARSSCAAAPGAGPSSPESGRSRSSCSPRAS